MRTQALLDYRDRLKDEARISNLLSAKLVQVPDAVEKLKSDSQDKDYLIGKLGSSLLALKAGQFPESAEPLIVFEEDLTPIQVRQYATLLYEQNKAGVAAVCSGNDRDSEYHYALGSSRMDMRALSKAMNSRLSGRGGGSSLMAQGTFRAAREPLRQRSWKRQNYKGWYDGIKQRYNEKNQRTYRFYRGNCGCRNQLQTSGGCGGRIDAYCLALYSGGSHSVHTERAHAQYREAFARVWGGQQAETACQPGGDHPPGYRRSVSGHLCGGASAGKDLYESSKQYPGILCRGAR